MSKDRNSITTKKPDTPEGIILESLLEGMAEYYSTELSQKIKRGMNETRLKGNFTGGYVLYGYKVVDHKIVIDEDQAEVVRYIFNQYAIGAYINEIYDYLIYNCIPYRGGLFRRSTVYNTLKNEKYTGIYRVNGKLYQNIYPAIIPTELFEKVRKKSMRNKVGKRSTETVYLLRYKLTCGYCGHQIHSSCGKSRKKILFRYYQCAGHTKHVNCPKKAIRKEVLEDIVVKKIIELLQTPKYMGTIIDNLLKAQANQVDGTVLSVLQKEQQQTRNLLDNVMRAVEKGLVNSTTGKRMKELEDRLAELEKQILLGQNKTNNKRFSKEEITQYYYHALELESKLLIDYLVDKITLYNDKMDITFTTPLNSTTNTDCGTFLLDR